MLLRRAAVLLVGSVALASCSNSIAWLETGAAASVIVVLGAQDNLRALAIDTRDPEAASRITPRTSDTEAYAFLFDDSLDELRVLPGDRGFAARGLSLADADSVRALRLDQGDPAWSPLASAPPSLVDRYIEMPVPCRTFAIRVEPLPGTAGHRPGFAVAIGPERLFVGTREGAFFDVRADAIVRLTAIAANTPSLAAFFDARTDQVWLVGEGGEMAVGHPDRGFESAPPMNNTAGADVWIDGSIGETRFELFAVTSTGTFERFDGERWTTLSPVPEVTQTRARWAVAWSGAGSAVAIGWSDEVAVLARDGVTEAQQLPVPPQEPPSTDALYSAAHVPSLGALIGTRYGRILRRVDGRWTLFDRPPLDVRAAVIASFEGGIFSGGQSGIFWQYFPEWGYCPEAAYISGEPHSVASLASGPVLVQDAPETGGPLALAFLRTVGGP